MIQIHLNLLFLWRFLTMWVKFLQIFVVLSMLPQLWVTEINSSDHAVFQRAYDPFQFFSSLKVFKLSVRGTCKSSSSPNENSGTSIWPPTNFFSPCMIHSPNSIRKKSAQLRKKLGWNAWKEKQLDWSLWKEFDSNSPLTFKVNSYV